MRVAVSMSVPMMVATTMKLLHTPTCAAPWALLLLCAACQAPKAGLAAQPGAPGGASASPAEVPSEAPSALGTGDNLGAMAVAEPGWGAAGGAKAAKAAKPAQQESKAKPKEKPKAKRPTAKSLEKQLSEAKEAKVDAERELRYAEADLEIAEMSAAKADIDGAESLRKARAELEAAQESLAFFNSKEWPIEATKTELAVSDADERLVTAETDLVGLIKIFEEETEARAKPEILRRGRRKVERAQRGLEMAKDEAKLKLDHELPAKLKKLSGAVRAKDAALKAAEIDEAKGRRSAELSVEKATDEADKKKRTARSKSAKVKSLQKRVNDARQGQNGKAKAAPKKK